MSVRICSLGAAALVGGILLGCGGGGGTAPQGAPPTISSVTPLQGTVGTELTISGTNFRAGASVLLDTLKGDSVQVASATTIYALVPAGVVAGKSYGVKVLNSDGTSVQFATPFTPIAPALLYVNGATKPSGNLGSTVILEGQAFGDRQGVGQVLFGTYAARAAVIYATVQANGQLGAWTSTLALPAPIAFHATVVATPSNSRIKGTAGFLYVLGGATTAAGTPTTTIYRGTLDATGAVTAWTTSATALPAPLHSEGAVIFRGDLYVAGGSTTSNVPVATVYRSRIDSTGALGSWQTEPALPFGRAYDGFSQFGGYLYAFGGDSAAVTPNDSNYTNNATKLSQIAYAPINLRTGDLAASSWTVNATTLTKAVSKHTAVIAGGTVLHTAGLYNGAATGSTEEDYAQLNSDGSVASFNGATGSHTIASAGGGNLFNHAALGYVDASGVAHVLVLGGDDVNSPSKKHKQVWFY